VRPLEPGHQLVQLHLAVKNIIAQNQTDRLTVNKLFTDQKGLSNPLRLRLYRIGELDPPASTITQQGLKTGNIMRG